MKANANQIRSAVDAASPDIRLYLFHGPDEAGARDIAARLARALGPDAERVDLEPAMLRANPGRLADEAASPSLFGTARHIRVAGAGEECAEACALLLEAPRGGAPAVMIAPALRATSRLVKLALGHPRAMSYACYSPEGADAASLATSIAREHGLRTTGATASRIATASNGDRAVMTREIEKLALYLDAAPERPRELDDAALDAVGAAVGDAELAGAIEAVVAGGPDRLAAELAALGQAGVSPVPLLRQLVRRLMALAELRVDIANGASEASVVERVFFRERAATARALRSWSAPVLSDAIDRARRAERAVMAPGNAGAVLSDQAIVAIARIAARQR